jgi:hypothetical protein
MPDNGLQTTTRSEETLPSPEEASRIAAVTGRKIAASDGRCYSGAVDDTLIDLMQHRSQSDGVVDAINRLADYPCDPSTWLAGFESRRQQLISAGSIDLAIEWLTQLRQKLLAS